MLTRQRSQPDEPRPAKRKRIAWDEANLDEVERGKSAKMKIDEPKTPYHYSAAHDGGTSGSDSTGKSPLGKAGSPVAVPSMDLRSHEAAVRRALNRSVADADSREDAAAPLARSTAAAAAPAAASGSGSGGSASGSASDVSLEAAYAATAAERAEFERRRAEHYRVVFQRLDPRDEEDEDEA